jgi:hypothetical protein
MKGVALIHQVEELTLILVGVPFNKKGELS